MQRTRPLLSLAKALSRRELPGFEHDPAAREKLNKVYETTLAELKDIPKTSVYRVNVEKLTKFRLRLINDAKVGIDDIEKRLHSGTLEEILFQAEQELSLTRDMQKLKPWEVQSNHKKLRIELID